MNFPKCLLYLTLALFISCKNQPKEEKKENPEIHENDTVVALTDAQLKNTPIETMTMGTQNVATVLKLNGKIDVPPQNLVSVSVPLGGYLKHTALLPGMHVRKGEVIAVMEDPQYIRLQQDYLQAKSKLHFAELDYQRQKSLNQSQASSDKVMQAALAEVNNQKILMNSIAQQLQLIHVNPKSVSAGNIKRNITVQSPIDGFVSKVNVNIGKYVNPSEVLFELVNPSDIHLGLNVFEKDVDRLKVGQPFVAYTNANPDKKYKGEIILISKDIDADGICQVHCHFSNYNKELLPGMYMNAEVETNNVLTSTLPEASIVSFEDKNYVFVEVANHSWAMTPVETGEEEDGFVQILNQEQLKGKKIVVKNAYALLMKLKNSEEED